MIDLYGMGSPNVIKIIIMLEELQLPYRLLHVDVLHGQQFRPEFLALNPLSKVPVIVDHDGSEPGLAVFESGAILIYLAETYGAFLPLAGRGRWETLKWLMVQVAHVGPMLGQRNHFQIMPSEATTYAGRRYAEQAARVYKVLESRLADHPYLAGNDYSIADIATYPWTGYLERHGFGWDEFPAINAWRTRIAAREAVVRSEAAMADLAPKDGAMGASATAADVDRFFGREATAPEIDFSLMSRPRPG